MKKFLMLYFCFFVSIASHAEPISDGIPYHLLYDKNPIYNLEQKPLLSILKNDLKESVLYGNMPDFEMFKTNRTLQYYPNGSVMVNFQINADNSGIQYVYYENGNVMTQIPFTNNARNGNQKIYYQNGILAGILPYQNDMLNGTVITYHINGNIQMRQTYQNNIRVNGGQMYHSNGNLHISQITQNGKTNGIKTMYYADGVLQAQIPYQNGVIEGDVQLYYPTGETLAILTFQNDTVIKNVCYTTFGQQATLNRAEIYKLKNGLFPINCYYQQE